MPLLLSQVPLVMEDDRGEGGQQKETGINMGERRRMGEERGKKAGKEKDQSANPNGLLNFFIENPPKTFTCCLLYHVC